MIRFTLLLASALLPLAARAQLSEPVGPHRQSGPRVGITVLSPGVVDQLNTAIRDGGIGAEISPEFPVITQVGWQFEFQTFQTEGGLTGMTELVPMLSGLEHGLLIPNLTWAIGLRTRGGLEAGVGPNMVLTFREPDEPSDPYAEPEPIETDVRMGLAMVAGFNTRVDGVSVPVNAAVVMGEHGPRVSLLVGINTSQTRY